MKVLIYNIIISVSSNSYHTWSMITKSWVDQRQFLDKEFSYFNIHLFLNIWVSNVCHMPYTLHSSWAGIYLTHVIPDSPYLSLFVGMWCYCPLYRYYKRTIPPVRYMYWRGSLKGGTKITFPQRNKYGWLISNRSVLYSLMVSKLQLAVLWRVSIRLCKCTKFLTFKFKKQLSMSFLMP